MQCPKIWNFLTKNLPTQLFHTTLPATSRCHATHSEIFEVVHGNYFEFLDLLKKGIKDLLLVDDFQEDIRDSTVFLIFPVLEDIAD